MPIGLPEFTRKGGRGPEMLVRPLLGQRQSSVFSIPSRAAVYAAVEAFTTVELWYEAHRKASAVAPHDLGAAARRVDPGVRHLPENPRDRCAAAGYGPELRRRVIESHPEVAFWRLNGGQAMRCPRR